MFIRIASALTSGTLVTFTLLFAMQSLIHLQPVATSDGPPPLPVDWIHLPDREPPAPPVRETFDKETLKNAPRPPTSGIDFGHGGIGIPAVPSDPGTINTQLTGLDTPDSPLTSIILVQPTYPAVAAQRELEGWVDVRFDVLPNGMTANIVVTASSHRLFESAAIQAAERFRFRAPVVDGIAHAVSGVEYRFRFDMEN